MTYTGVETAHVAVSRTEVRGIRSDFAGVTYGTLPVTKDEMLSMIHGGTEETNKTYHHR